MHFLKEVLDKSGQLPESPLSCTSTSSQLSSPLSSPSPETSSSSSATCSSYKSSPATSTPTHNKKPAFSHFDLLTSTTLGSSTSGTSWIVNYHLPSSVSYMFCNETERESLLCSCTHLDCMLDRRGLYTLKAKLNQDCKKNIYDFSFLFSVI